MSILKEQLLEINRLYTENEQIYHDLAQHYGLSDSIHWILYMLYESETGVSQTELCEAWHLSKQTVNSAVSAMIQRGWVSLEIIPGTKNRKNIVLTEKGRQFSSKVIGEMQEIEENAFSRIPEEERELFITVFRKNNQYMREEYEKKLNEDQVI